MNINTKLEYCFFSFFFLILIYKTVKSISLFNEKKAFFWKQFDEKVSVVKFTIITTKMEKCMEIGSFKGLDLNK